MGVGAPVMCSLLLQVLITPCGGRYLGMGASAFIEFLTEFLGRSQGGTRPQQQWIPSTLGLFPGRRGAKGKQPCSSCPSSASRAPADINDLVQQAQAGAMKNQITSLVQKVLKEERQAPKSAKPKTKRPRIPSLLSSSETSEVSSPCRKQHKKAKRKPTKAHKKAHKKSRSPSSS